MMVCDICWTPSDLTSGTAVIRDSSGGNSFLLGKNSKEAFADLCKSCIELLRSRDWRGLAERETNATIKRLEA